MDKRILAYKDYLRRQIKVCNSILSENNLTNSVRKHYEGHLDVLIDAMEEFDLVFNLMGNEVSAYE